MKYGKIINLYSCSSRTCGGGCKRSSSASNSSISTEIVVMLTAEW